MKKQLAALVLVGFAGVVFAQGAQQQPGQSSAQPRQQQSAQPQQQQPRQQQQAPERQSQLPSFDTADSNKDGQLSRAEASDIDGFDFSKADVNQNASVDRQEYTSAMSSSESPAPRTPR